MLDAGRIVGAEALAEEVKGRRSGRRKGMSNGNHARIILETAVGRAVTLGAGFWPRHDDKCSWGA
ncbi:hypothetical protein ZRA01_31870 [Zoogloea ramigera]|uniref:Uncharacterized protein n=1 Tax=Zoogloea ramigera TaxID=350 RepID=A0A4Y4D045_ZOORA|nr:hypothetical protein ZRA01_31870 [Zoogloea ramigera]